MFKVLIDTTPLTNQNSIRGVGAYTRFLVSYLSKIRDLELRKSYDKNNQSFKPDLIHYPFFDLFFSTETTGKIYPPIENKYAPNAYSLSGK